MELENEIDTEENGAALPRSSEGRLECLIWLI